MKKLLLVFSLFAISLSVSAQGTWVPQATGFTPVSTGVTYISAVDTNVLWIAAYDGVDTSIKRQDFSRTIDGGLNWVAGLVPAPSTFANCMIFGLNADTAWSMLYDASSVYGGGIWKTMDGGLSWTQQDSGIIFSDPLSFPNVVHFWNDSVGFAMGDAYDVDYEIYTTTDGGDNWVRVPFANVPPPLNNEYGIVGHYNVIGDTVWFDTNKGRVYRSVDRGLNWTVSNTGHIIPVDGAMDICFYNSMEGFARLYNNTAGTNTVKRTSDGGDTWTAGTVTGNMFGSDVQYVPGTVSRIMSSGTNINFAGTSYSDDGGITWTTIEQLDQRSALGLVDSLHMWVGGFTASPTAEGIFKFEFLTPVACNDPSVSPGIASASDSVLCANDTLVVTSTGVASPSVGDYYGVSWVVSSADISGSVNPLNEPSLVLIYGITSPAPSTSTRAYVNDGVQIGAGSPYGIYYWTPVVFGNATSATPPTNFQDLTLDPACTYTGNSVMVDVAAPGDPRCSTVGISKVDAVKLAVFAYQENENTVRLHINAATQAEMQVEMYDINGRRVYTGNMYLSKGSNVEMININDLRGGTYMIKAVSNGNQTVTKLVIF
ncbi:MAG: T9SS type A sorting domain-containing protein [Bacteroidetes bacterium]|nr:MAG: T9SS type A sorting domain-containing protein [Bacteroidota bacterium]